VPATNRTPRRRSNARSFRPGLFGLGFGVLVGGLVCCRLFGDRLFSGGLVCCGLLGNGLLSDRLVGDGLAGRGGFWLGLLFRLGGAAGIGFGLSSVVDACWDSIGRG